MNEKVPRAVMVAECCVEALAREGEGANMLLHFSAFFTKINSPIRRHITRSSSPKASNSPPRVTVVKAPVVNVAKGFQDKFDVEKAGEEIDQQYVLFPMWYSSFTNPQNTDKDAAFDGKEHKFDEKKPEFEVNVSLSSSAQSRKQDEKTKKEAKGKRVNTPRCDEDMLELMELMVFLLSKVEKVEIRVNVVDLQVFAVWHMLLLLVYKLLLFSLTNWCCSLSAVRSLIAVKKVNDIIQLQALVDKKKVVVTEAIIREALRLDDAEGVECLPKEEIFAELARMGYEKPSTKLMFYKAFFSSQVGKGFSGVETSLFESMLVAQEVVVEGDDEVHRKQVNAGDVAEGDVSAAHEEVPTAVEEPSIPSPTPPTLQPQPSHDILSTSQKRKGKKLERRNKVKVLKLRRLQKVGTSQRVETSDETVMDDVSNQGRIIAEIDQDADVVLEDDKEDDREERQAESQAEIYKIDLDHANKVLSMQDDETKPAEVQEVVEVVTTAKLIIKVVTDAITATPSRRRKGVKIRDLQEESTTSTIIPAETKSKDKGKGILVKEPKPLKKKQQIKQNEKYARELQAGLNKNIDWDEAIDHVKNKANENPAIKRYQVEDLEALWILVKERFSTTKPKNFSDDFLLVTLGVMFEKPDIHAQIWKNQRSVHGPAKVKGWKILESCGVQIITFTTTQLILLVEKKYPLKRFTLDQILNAVRLEIEEESEVSLELLRFIRQQHQEGQLE
uniref:Uncharacterized protein n=1 Tax=Tanacetum cinerariifolium TaxID=118510 RepID=A0A6L2NF47_TANCI|nr:hypothetical protein [Tanacetum cinerariifolium]